MLLDIIFAILIVFAILKGYQRGLIIGIFSFLGIMIGLAAAIKLSAVVARKIGPAVNVSDKWLPVISFIIVFVIVLLLVRLGANMLHKTIEIAMLGWVNKLGGILFYAAIYIIVYSIILFYAVRLELISQETIDNSATYSFVQPWGPKVIDSFAAIVPIFRDMFSGLEDFFEGVGEKVEE
jgi:membrane protein required for colicin V production